MDTINFDDENKKVHALTYGMGGFFTTLSSQAIGFITMGCYYIICHQTSSLWNNMMSCTMALLVAYFIGNSVIHMRQYQVGYLFMNLIGESINGLTVSMIIDSEEVVENKELKKFGVNAPKILLHFYRHLWRDLHTK